MKTQTNFTNDIRLRSQSSISFETANVPGLGSWLEDRGFIFQRGRVLAEYGRYRRSGQLVVLYNSGSVLVQGTEVESTLDLLRSLGAVSYTHLTLPTKRIV